MKIILLLFALHSIVFAQTPFILTKFKTVYPLVEIYTDKVPTSYIPKITSMIKKYANELGVQTDGFSDRPLGIMITRVAVGNSLVLKVALMIGEEVNRLDDKEEVFAITYQNVDIFEVENLDEDLIDSVTFLLEEFKEQYIEDNI